MIEILSGRFDDFISRSDAARILGVDPSRLSKSIEPGKRPGAWSDNIHYIEVCGRYYFVRKDVEEASRVKAKSRYWRRPNGWLPGKDSNLEPRG